MKTFQITINRVQSNEYQIEASSIEEAVEKAYQMAFNEDWSDREAEYNHYSEE